MQDLSKRISALSPEQRALFELKLKQRGLATAKAQAITRRADGGPCPLSVDQERLWFVEQMSPGNYAYNVNSATRIKSKLDVGILERAINEIIRRHEILRTNFIAIEGQPFQIVRPERYITVPVVNLEGVPASERQARLQQVTDETARLPFDLAEDLLVRVVDIRLSEEDHVLSMSMHHIVTDWWSYDIFGKEMDELYSAFLKGEPSPYPELPIQFADFAIWQREWMKSDAMRAQVDYWKKQLEGARFTLDFPTDRPRPPVQTFDGARQPIELSRELSEGLRELSHRENVSPFMTALAIINVLIYRYCGQDDMIIASPSANRNRSEIESLIGYFLNLLMLRSDLSGNPTFMELLKRVRETTLAAYAHQDLPFTKLLEELNPERDTSRNPIFQVACVFLEDPDISFDAGALRGDPAPVPDGGTSRFDMTFAIWNRSSGMTGYIEYNTDLFDADTMARVFEHFKRLAEAVVANSADRIDSLPMMTEAERKQITEWNDTHTDYPRHSSLAELFHQQVALSPNAPALSCHHLTLSYDQLNRRANQLAHYLRSLGAAPEVPVGICLDRGADLIVAMLAIIKAGAAYVPLDPSYPIERLSAIIEDVSMGLIVTDEAMMERLPAFFGQVVAMDSDSDAITSHSEQNPELDASGDNLAYIIYTSGSTGKPKGIAVPHKAISRLVKQSDYVRLGPDDVVAQASNSSFDACTFEVWGALLNGSRLVVISKQQMLSVDEMVAVIRQQRVNTMFITTALFNQVVSQNAGAFAGMKQVLFGGEKVDASRVKEVIESEGRPQRLLHVYGPTESTTFASWKEVKQVTGSSVEIGKAIANTQMYVLDKGLNEVPVGVMGEIYIGGEGLARGYWNDAVKTAERFLPNPYSGEAGARMYATGDIGRYKQGGEIEFIGRNDNQVKIRGFRIELEEIEAALYEHGAVRAAVAVVREEEAEKQLVAYVVTDGQQPLEAGELRDYLKGKLPEYMIPAIVMLDEMPLTPNGKIDRRALPVVAPSRPESSGRLVAPRTRIEEMLADVWAQVLGVEQVGIYDNFFDLGGDSIRTIQVTSKAQAKGLNVSINSIFHHPTIYELAREVSLGAADAVKQKPVEPFELISEQDRQNMPEGIEDAYPLTRLQAGMVFHSEYSWETAVYHDVLSFHTRAQLDIETMRVVLESLLERHEILRSSFDLSSFSEPLQLVHEKVELPLTIGDLSHLSASKQEAEIDRLIEVDTKHHFEWNRPPLLRFQIHRRSEETFQFILTIHHAIIDGWSLSTLLTELFRHYLLLLGQEGGELPSPPAIKFRDFVAMERQALKSEEHLRYWRDELSGCDTTLLPRRPQSEQVREPRRVRNLDVEIAPETHAGLKRLASAADAPLKSVLLAAHLRALSLATGQKDVITGYTSNGRPEELDGERVIGLFLNTLPLRANLSGGTWVELVKQVYEKELAILPYRRFPLLDLQRMAARQLFEVSFNYVYFHVVQGISGLKDMEFLDFDGAAETNFTLLANFGIDPGSGELHLGLQYDENHVTQEQAEYIAGYYARTLQAMAFDASSRYEYAPLLSERERHQLLVEWNDTSKQYPSGKTIHRLFEEQAERTPHNIAVTCRGQSLTYAELNRRANQLARYIKRVGVGPDAAVGLCVERSLEMVVGVLGILKAGGAYLPLDPAYPQQRLLFMLEDARARALLTQRRLLDSIEGGTIEAVCLDTDWPAIAQESEANLAVETTGDNLAYVIYTSGSTGKPKGVEVCHRGVSRLLFGVDYVDLSRGEVIAQTSPLAFDASTLEIWGALLHGGRLVIPAEQILLATEASKLIEQHGVTTMWLTSSLFNSMIDENAPALEGLKQLLVGSEALSAPHIRKAMEALKHTQLINGYGPTENTTFTCCYPIAAVGQADKSIPIGRPIANTRAYILDAHMQPVPAGVAGELYVAGAGLARGYLRRPDLTAERFVPDPFSNEPGARLYKTGDLTRHLPDGNIEFLGRIDDQVKLRGFRIEPGEIESVLAEHPAVREAVVLAQEGASAERRLVAYVVSREAQLAADELRQFLRDRLPDYMVPSAFVLLEALPLTPNGKLDRRALPVPEQARPETERPYVAPRNAVEELVAGIWAQTLGIDRVGINDSIFDLGGHSLSVTQVVSRVRETFRVELPLRKVFERPTVADLASLLVQDSANRTRIERTAQLMLRMARMSEEEAQALVQEGKGRLEEGKAK